MSDGVVRCPYCVLGAEFRRMLRRSKNCFLCLSCGHRTNVGPSSLRCACPKCQRMDLIANRCRNIGAVRKRLAPNLPGHW